jgi:hypothetical protein
MCSSTVQVLTGQNRRWDDFLLGRHCRVRSVCPIVTLQLHRGRARQYRVWESVGKARESPTGADGCGIGSHGTQVLSLLRIISVCEQTATPANYTFITAGHSILLAHCVSHIPTFVHYHLITAPLHKLSQSECWPKHWSSLCNISRCVRRDHPRIVWRPQCLTHRRMSPPHSKNECPAQCLRTILWLIWLVRIMWILVTVIYLLGCCFFISGFVNSRLDEMSRHAMVCNTSWCQATGPCHMGRSLTIVRVVR